MTIETQIASLVSASNTLTSRVENTLADIDTRVDAARSELNAAVAAVNGTVKSIYIDAVAGNDSNPGTEALPLKTAAPAGALSGKGYDSVTLLFRNGQTHTWPAAAVYVKAVNDVVIGQYGAGSMAVIQVPAATGYTAMGHWCCTGVLVAFARRVVLSWVRIELPDVSTAVYPYNFWQGFIRCYGGGTASHLTITAARLYLRSPLVLSWTSALTIDCQSTYGNYLYVDVGKGFVVNNIAASTVSLTGMHDFLYHASGWDAWNIDGTAGLTGPQCARSLVRYTAFAPGAVTPSNVLDATGIICPANLA